MCVLSVVIEGLLIKDYKASKYISVLERKSSVYIPKYFEYASFF